MSAVLLLIYTAVLVLGPHDVAWLALLGVSLAAAGFLCAVVESEVRR